MPNIAGVVLAAGGSSRLGEPKQLLTWRGETLIRRAVRAAAEAGCNPVVIVVGETGDAIRSEVDIRDSRISSFSGLKTAPRIAVVENAEWRSGVGTSIRRGLEELGESVEGVVLLTCDQPFVDAAMIGRLIEEHQQTGKPIVASSYANTLGVPALFDRSLFEELRALPGVSGAKSIIEGRRAETALVRFEEGAIDIDTREDFERLKDKSRLS
jgi:molybdenum cofactor cytidylyltransferase